MEIQAVDQADFQQLILPQVRDWILLNRGENASQLALRGAPKGIPLSLACQQIALLQKAKHKLPTWSKAGCLLPKRAYEQCSGEAIAAAKPWNSGIHALDLTCGLGVDSWTMAQHYQHVTSLEPDPDLAKVVAHNADLLDCKNQKVLCQTAEAFLTEYQGPIFDLAYIDPDRRNPSGGRVHALKDCQPNILQLLPQLTKVAKRILIKTSPMLDISALKNDFDGKAKVWVLSEGGECKELLAELDASTNHQQTAAIFIRKGKTYAFEGEAKQKLDAFAAIGAYLYEADTALYKADLAVSWYGSVNNPLEGGLTSKNGYFTAEIDNTSFHGHRFKVLEVFPWKPSSLRKAIKSKGIKKIQVSRRDFDLPMETIRKQLKMPEGGKYFLLLTNVEGSGRTAILAERLV